MEKIYRSFPKKLFVVLLFFIPLALFFAMRAKLSWRPRVMGPMKGEITALTWSPDGKWLAGAAGDSKVWGVPSEINVWSFPGGQLQRRFSATKNSLQLLRFSADSQELVGIDIAQKLHRWDWTKGKALTSTLPPGVFAISDDAEMVAMAARGGVAIHLVKNGHRVDFLKDLRGVLKVAAFSPDNKKLALFFVQSSRASGLSLQIWKPSIGNEPTQIFRNSEWEIPDSLQFLPKGIPLPTSFSGTANGNLIITPSQPQLAPMPIALSQKNAAYIELLTSSIDLLEAPAWQIERHLYPRVLPSEMKTLAFSPDGGTLAGGDDKGFITLWRIK